MPLICPTTPDARIKPPRARRNRHRSLPLRAALYAVGCLPLLGAASFGESRFNSAVNQRVVIARNAVEDVLHGQRRQNDPEHAGNDADFTLTHVSDEAFTSMKYRP